MRKITLKTKGLSSKQYSTLILELNIVAKNWKKFGGTITIQGEDAERIISWGNKLHETIRTKPRHH